MLGLFFVIPYHAVVDVFVALQPFYVFCGVACITGAVIGLGGRFFAGMASAIILGPDAVEGAVDGQRDADQKPRKR